MAVVVAVNNRNRNRGGNGKGGSYRGNKTIKMATVITKIATAK